MPSIANQRRPGPFALSVLLAVLLATLVLLVSLPARAELDRERLADFVTRGMAQWQVPGMAVAVVSSDEVLFGETFTAAADPVRE